MSETTEDSIQRFRGLDAWPTEDVVRSLWGGQMQAVAACLHPIPALVAAVEAAADRLGRGQGRLVYVGAGSSGMIAALDAIDLADTFDWPDARTVILLAGGLDLSRGISAEIEDRAEESVARLVELGIGSQDVVVGVSASGGSVYTSEAVAEARRRGALTIGLVSTANSELARAAEYPIVVDTGAEVFAGSTRMGAGTAQKVILNILSTAVMTRLGAVYDNLMVNVRPNNAKLRRRCIAIVAHIADVDADRAAAAIARHGDVKRAVLALAGAEPGTIDERLAAVGGRLREALDTLRSTPRS